MSWENRRNAILPLTRKELRQVASGQVPDGKKEFRIELRARRQADGFVEVGPGKSLAISRFFGQYRVASTLWQKANSIRKNAEFVKRFLTQTVLSGYTYNHLLNPVNF